MTCPECKEPRGCSCTWILIPEREYKICPICAERITKTEHIRNDPNTRIIQATSVPIQRGDLQTGQS